MESDEEQYTIDTTPFRVKVFEPSPGPSGDRLRKYNALKLNIDRQKTIGDIEYDDSILVEELYKGSNEKVWTVCIQCGKYRHVAYKNYRHLCHACSSKTDEKVKKLSDAKYGENNPMFGRTGEKHHLFGKHPSEESRKKMSDAHSGENHHMFGKHHSEETIQKMSDAQSGENHHNFGKHLSEEHRINISCGLQGIPPEEFTGFTHEEHVRFRKSVEYANWRTAVFERDNYTCQECGSHGGVDLEAHHIIPYSVHPEPEYSLNTDNGITLCKLCHDKTKLCEDDFYNKYTAIVEAKCGFKGDFLSSSVILEGLKKQNGPTQSLLNDEFVIPEKSEHQIKISNLVKSIVKQCVTYPPKPHSTRQPTIFDY
jgi:hypothetical protein